ncbi:MAG: oligosaccharide flippase family protein [Candidatus Amesbacteria bacterium]|nr:oligosaccharide flippase family protein [Candidatus Amesbacteria bacterium]
MKSGLTWTAGLRLMLRLITILRMAVLARILSKASLGVFGIVTMVLALLEISTETGINIFLMQEKGKVDKYIDTAWVLSIIRGSLIALLIVILTPWISTFFNSPDTLNLLYLLALAPFIRGFINPAIIIFLKELRFGREFFLRGSIFMLEAGVSVVVCWYTRSPIGMVWGLIASAIFEVLLSWIFIYPRPKFSLNPVTCLLILSRGKWVTGFGLLDYLFTQTDNIVVGKLLGETSLGVYQYAYKISTTPVSEIVDVFYRATFPIFSQMNNGGKNLKKAVIKTVITVNLMTIGLGLTIWLFARPIILILFGSNWLEAVPILQILAFLGIARGMAYSFNAAFMAQKQQKYVTIIILTSTLGLMFTIVPFVKMWGLTGAAVAATFGAVLSLPVAIYLAHKSFKNL